MQDPIGLAIPNRAQHNGLGRQRRRHDPLRVKRESNRPTTPKLDESMKPVLLYTTDRCGSCVAAKKLLEKRGIGFEEINLARDPDSRARLQTLTGMFTFPQIVVGERAIGGFTELLAADREGRLDELVKEQAA